MMTSRLWCRLQPKGPTGETRLRKNGLQRIPQRVSYAPRSSRTHSLTLRYATDPSAPRKAPTIGDIPDIDGPASLSSDLVAVRLDSTPARDEMPDMDDIPDMDDDDGMGGGLVEEEDDAALKPVVPSVLVFALYYGELKQSCARKSNDNLIRVRTYDCSITYDKYYQTPRMWLLGYDEVRFTTPHACAAELTRVRRQHKSPLPPASAFDDVSADHAQKTVTIEPFPHSSLSMASVHPCKHSSVMKKVIERMDKGVAEAQRKEQERQTKEGSKKWGLKGKKLVTGVEEEGPEGLRVDQYLVVFLKFMSSIGRSFLPYSLRRR